MHKSKYTVYRGGSLESDKLVIPGESSITSYIPSNYADLSDMELMSRLITSGGDEEELVKLGQESARRTRHKEYEKYSDKLGDIYIAKWKKAGLSNTATLQLLGNPEFVNIRKLVNGTEDMKTIQKKLQDLYKSLDKSIDEKEKKKSMTQIINTLKDGYRESWKSKFDINDKNVDDFVTEFFEEEKQLKILEDLKNDKIRVNQLEPIILFSMVELDERLNDEHKQMMKDKGKKSTMRSKERELKKEVAHMKESLEESNSNKIEIPVITSSKKKKSKSKAKATAEEVAEAEELYKRTEELSKQQEKEGNIRLKELRSLDEGKEAEEEEKQKIYEGSQHIKTFDKLFTEIFKHIKTSGGKGHLFEDIMTKTNIPSEVPISAKENKELNQSIRHILTAATGRTQTDIPVLSSKFLPPNCSNFIDGLPYDLLDQYKNFIELKYYNTYLFGYKVKNGRLYESASGVNIEVKSVQFQMSKFIRDNLDDFKIFYIREGPNNYKIHNVYIKKDNNNKTINKPTNTEYNKNLTVIMAFEKSFYYFNPLELLTDDIMDLASPGDTKAYKITSDVYIPNLSKLNFFINESLISIGDDGLARNDTRIPFSYFKRI
jgi:hypothetical protein